MLKVLDVKYWFKKGMKLTSYADERILKTIAVKIAVMN